MEHLSGAGGKLEFRRRKSRCRRQTNILVLFLFVSFGTGLDEVEWRASNAPDAGHNLNSRVHVLVLPRDATKNSWLWSHFIFSADVAFPQIRIFYRRPSIASQLTTKGNATPLIPSFRFLNPFFRYDRICLTECGDLQLDRSWRSTRR